jgi:hypothetical protein
VTRTPYDDAIEALHRAPVEAFVAERKRLAAALKAAGDRDGAARLAKRPRPSVSAWAVNQLHWHARAELDAMFETAARLRSGQLDATAAHRDAIAALRARATELLRDGGHPTTEATLRRVTTTLAALAAVGGFDPDPPGALAADRDPPGFDGVGVIAARPTPVTEIDRERALREERARRAAERDRLAFVLKSAHAELHAREREVDVLRAQIAELEQQLAALAEA